MQKRFMDKVVLVTGAARGIGQSTAARFAEEGAKIAVCDLSAEAATETAAAIASEYGVQAAGFGCNVADEAQVDQMVDAVLKEFGAIASSTMLALPATICCSRCLWTTGMPL
jgi:3-oxoacyl-[acyl-carrier protein] reductase